MRCEIQLQNKQVKSKRAGSFDIYILRKLQQNTQSAFLSHHSSFVIRHSSFIVVVAITVASDDKGQFDVHRRELRREVSEHIWHRDAHDTTPCRAGAASQRPLSRRRVSRGNDERGDRSRTSKRRPRRRVVSPSSTPLRAPPPTPPRHPKTPASP